MATTTTTTPTTNRSADVEVPLIPEKVVGKTKFNGRYMVMLWKLDRRAKAKVTDVIRRVEALLPLESGYYGSLSPRGDEVRAVIRFAQKTHITDVGTRMRLGGWDEQTLSVAKMAQKEKIDEFLGRGTAYVKALPFSKKFGSVESLVPVRNVVRAEHLEPVSVAGYGGNAARETVDIEVVNEPVTQVSVDVDGDGDVDVDASDLEDDEEDEEYESHEEHENGEEDSDIESVYGLTAQVRQLMLKRDVAAARVEVAVARLGYREAELALSEGGAGC